MKLGYSSSTWNYEPDEYTWNPLEEISYDSDYFNRDELNEIHKLGYDEDQWDCCINHYRDYDWEELAYWNYTEQIEAYEALGWTNETFSSSDAMDWPESELLIWENLTNHQQEMASSKLCYIPETWDELIPLYDWPVDFNIPDAWP